MSPQFIVYVILCAQPPNSMISVGRKQFPNAVIGARYPNAVIRLVRVTYPKVAMRLVRDTQMRRSDWCEQHTTLHANIDFF